MGVVVVIGAPPEARGWSLAGAVVREAADAAAVHAAWAGLGDDVSLVVLTPEAARVLRADLAGRTGPLAVVLPG
ncbi:hypothetical protein [Allokutzneria oryzae]|uniref:ATPase n=1 Tax=Allokutzneria oryzae TaxID=1378989 RepID=A0ABV6A3S0_9PSEU